MNSSGHDGADDGPFLDPAFDAWLERVRKLHADDAELTRMVNSAESMERRASAHVRSCPRCQARLVVCVEEAIFASVDHGESQALALVQFLRHADPTLRVAGAQAASNLEWGDDQATVRTALERLADDIDEGVRAASRACLAVESTASVPLHDIRSAIRAAFDRSATILVGRLAATTALGAGPGEMSNPTRPESPAQSDPSQVSEDAATVVLLNGALRVTILNVVGGHEIVVRSGEPALADSTVTLEMAATTMSLPRTVPVPGVANTRGDLDVRVELQLHTVDDHWEARWIAGYAVVDRDVSVVEVRPRE